MTTLARCLLAKNDASGAEMQLLVGWELLQAYATAGTLFPGQAAALGAWWRAKGQVAAQRGDFGEATTAFQQCLAYGRMLEGPYALGALARTLDELGAAAKASGDLNGEALVRQEAQAIRERLKLHPCA